MTTTHPTWRKSTYSTNTQNCVELATADGDVLLRDSKHPEAGHLTFIDAARAGELDNLA